MKNIILLTLYFAFAVHANAQSSQEKAKAYYFSAVEQYESRNFSKTIEYCQQVEDLLGGTNARVEALRLKSYFDQGDITKAKESLKTFSSLKPDESLSKEVSPYIVKIEEAEKAEKRRQELAAEKAEEEKQKKIDAANRKQKLIQTAIAEGGFDKNGLKKVEYETVSGFESIDNEGFIDETGKEVIPIDHHYVDYLNKYADDPYIRVSNYKERLHGLYDIKGNVILPMGHYSYDNGWPPFDSNGFALGLLKVKKNGKWGYVNKSGEVVIPFKFDSAGTFRLTQKSVFTKSKKNTYVGNAAYVTVGRDSFYINTRGERISN